MSFIDQTKHLPSLGVGVTYCTELHELIQLEASLFDLIEIEPQTLWIRDTLNHDLYTFPQETKQILASLPQQKIIHSVGVPVGGNKPADPKQLNLLKQNIKDFNSPWASEHLSFNSTLDFHTGFFLPPRQTERGIALALNNIKRLQQSLKIPIAVETGVNYLKTRHDEMEDGLFVREVSRAADCGILLDLHNLYTNELNHRQSVEKFISQIDTERVIEMHLAGGIEMDGYWLDAHSGVMPERLIRMAEELVPILPNLKAIVFEILPSYIPLVGMKTITGQIERIKSIWSLKKTPSPKSDKVSGILVPGLTRSDDTYKWEHSLGSMATGLGLSENENLFHELQDDKGIRVLQSLISEFRASMLVSMLKLSSRYLMLVLGIPAFELFLKDFYSNYSPKQFGTDEAANFITYLRGKNIDLPILYELLDFEEGVIATLVDGKTRAATFTYDPIPLLSCLFQGRLPEEDRRAGK
ncbi:MAG: DUF692 family multinuclear iron-containing protein, partial [Flavitalea sp.]